MYILYDKKQSAERETLSNDHPELSVSKHDISCWFNTLIQNPLVNNLYMYIK
jgi:hypothetical protein